VTTTRPSIPAEKFEMPSWSTPVLTIGVLVFLIWFLSTGVSQIFVAMLLIGLGLLAVLIRPDLAAFGTLIFLPFLGDIRRYISVGGGKTSQDPMLMVAPAIAGMIFARMLFERGARLDTRLAKLVLAMMVVMAIEILNPLQGGITVGLAGALFYIVPLLWFWAGRSLSSETATAQLLRQLIPIIALSAAILGLFQTYVGWLSFEAQWIREQTYGQQGFAALIIDGHVVRPFGFFCSPSEFSGYLSIGFIACAVPLIAGRRRLTAFLMAPIGYMLFLSAVRTAISLTAFSVLAVWAVMGRDAKGVAGRFILVVLFIVPALVLGLNRLKDVDHSDRVGALVGHSVDGLTNPTESTAGAHGDLWLEGISGGIMNPIGYGLGSSTPAAGRYGDRAGAAMEHDIPNLFFSLGVFGGILYLVLMFQVLRVVYGLFRDRGSLIALTVLGILISQFGYWALGTHYSTSALVWFLIGSIDRTQIPVPAMHLAPRRAMPDRA